MENVELSEKVIGAAYKVSTVLGCGFLEKVYENALALELRKSGLKVIQQYPIKVYYDDTVVGEYIADLIVNGDLLVELKAVNEMNPVFNAQIINYLKATKIKTGLLLNFGKPRVEVRRFDNRYCV